MDRPCFDQNSSVKNRKRETQTERESIWCRIWSRFEVVVSTIFVDPV